MIRSNAKVSTEQPSRYLKQLCRHFGHKNEVSFDELEGKIRLASGTCRLSARAVRELLLEATADSEDDLQHLQGVIGSHLERFGQRDGLVVAWSAPPVSLP